MADTIQLMKQRVLDMAIRGDLVEQRPDEGTAIELINKIRENKEQKKSKDIQIVSEKQELFEFPDSWELVDLESIIEMVGNKSNQIKSKQVQDNGAIPVVSQGKNLIDGYSDQVSRTIKITEPLILFGDHTKNVKYIDFDFIIGADGTKTFKSLILIPKFLYYWTMYASSIIEDRGYNRHYTLLKKVPVTLPPLLEQKRIVSKIEEIFSIIDKIAERKENALQTIQLIRQTTLQQAIQGKLVEQNEQDEPASELITRIEEEKHKLIKEKKIKKEKKLPDVSEAEKSFAIPDNWEWVRLGNISSKVHYGYTSSAVEEGNVKMVRITDIQNGNVNWENVPYCHIENDKIQDYDLMENDIVIARTGGTVGKSYIIKDIPTQSVFASYLIRVILIEKQTAEYISKYLESPYYWNQISDKSQGTGQPNVNATQLKKLPIPLPPISEQKRITEKVEQIMEICDQMEELFK